MIVINEDFCISYSWIPHKIKYTSCVEHAHSKADKQAHLTVDTAASDITFKHRDKLRIHLRQQLTHSCQHHQL